MTKHSKISNPFHNRDLNIQLKFPIISWSSMNAFESYGKDEWYEQYVLGHRSEINDLMATGIEVGTRLATDPGYLPTVPRPETYELNLRATLGRIGLTGHLDGWTETTKELIEYKTTSNVNRWNQKKVDNHGQLDFYCLLLWENYQILPNDISIKLITILCKEGIPKGMKVFQTKRTMQDILVFAKRIKDIHKDMHSFVGQKQNMRIIE